MTDYEEEPYEEVPEEEYEEAPPEYEIIHPITGKKPRGLKVRKTYLARPRGKAYGVKLPRGFDPYHVFHPRTRRRRR
jgi:hypothetical protein